MKKEIKHTVKRNDKPAPFIAFGSTEPISDEEIEKRKRIIERAEKLGIHVTSLDTEVEYENPYKLEALVFIWDDKPVPEELMKKIEEFESSHKQHFLTDNE